MPTEPITTETLDAVEQALAKTENDLCEGFCKDFPSKTFFAKEMDLDCSGCRSRVALAQLRAERKEK